MPSYRNRRHWRHNFAKDYHNPILDRQTTGGRVKIYLAAILIIGIVLFFGLLSASWLNLKNLSITGNHRVTTKQLNQLFVQQGQKNTWWIFKQQNYFLFDSLDFKRQILEQFKVSNVQINKKFPNQLNLTLIERLAVLTLHLDSKTYHLDIDGIIFEETTPLDTESLTPIVVIKKNTEITLDSMPLTEGLVDFLLAVNRQFNQLGQPVDQFLLDNIQSRKVSVKTKEGWLGIFDLRQDLAKQINNLKILLQSLGESTKNLEYIDLRFGEKINYQLKKTQ